MLDIKCLYYVIILSLFCMKCFGQQFVNLDAKIAEATFLYKKANGYKGIWYRNQLSNNDYIYKYSGGMAVYPANHRPFAVYSPEVEKTFFCFGGTDSDNLTLLHNVSYFDHKTKMLANPTVLRGQLMRMIIRLFRLMKKVLSGYFQLLMELQDLLISIKVKDRMI